MKIVHILPKLEMGGAETLTIELAKQMNQFEGCSADILVFDYGEPALEAKVEQYGITFFNLKTKPLSLRTLFKTASFINKHHYDIIHTHLSSAQYLIAILSFFTKLDAILITTEHNTWNRRRNYSFFKVIDRFIYHRYQQIICVSQKTQQMLQEWLPTIRHKTLVIFNGIDTTHFKTKAKLSVVPKTTRNYHLTNIAKIEFKRKDQPTLLHAISKLDNVHLTLTGIGPDSSACKQLIHQLNLDTKVSMPGVVNNVANLLHHTDIYIQPSLIEGFGLAVIEAMAAGVPCIVSNVDGMRDVVGDAALLFEPGNVTQLTERITQLLNDTKLRTDLIQKGYNKAEQYSITNTTNEYLACYDNLSSSNNT
jgi:hypothetical protein